MKNTEMHILFQKIFNFILPSLLILFSFTASADVYKGQKNGVEISFEYPNDWKIREIQGQEEKFFEINIQKSKDGKEDYNSALSVTMYPSERFTSVEDAINDYKGKYVRFKDFKIISSNNKEVEVEYVLKLPFYNPKAKDVKIREKVMFVMKNGNCFKLRLNSVETDYSKFLPFFHTMCETFQ